MTIEQRALLLDRQAVIEVISALSRMRMAAELLIKARYGDGEVDSYMMHAFIDTVEEIEKDLEDEDR